MSRLKSVLILSILFFFSSTVFAVQSADAADMKIGVMNVQQVLTSSVAGKAAKEKFDAKMKELQDKFKVEEEDLLAMQKDIEKKSSAWSEETKQEKVLEFQKRRRELQNKAEDGRSELKVLQDKELAPILKALEKVVDTYGSANGFTVILDAKNHVIYFDETIDISDKLIIELDAAMAK
ncbi:MAG: OmpH family outer membrane protein [Desulfocapsaceae bacterium]|jgi:outer membrane protein|nr:OmpH family outer membrane protein [Desulfocapsaceae bacterium]